jgi:hypothetical protein
VAGAITASCCCGSAWSLPYKLDLIIATCDNVVVATVKVVVVAAVVITVATFIVTAKVNDLDGLARQNLRMDYAWWSRLCQVNEI